MGYSKRKEQQEVLEVIELINKRIEGVTLGQLCARGIVKLEVKCHQCPRRGRYSVTRLIDRHGAMLPLTKLAEMMSGDCSQRVGQSFYRKCGVYFPEVK